MIRFIIKFAIFFIAALLLTFLWSKIAGAAEADAAQHRRIEALAQRLNDFSSLEADFTQKRTLGATGRTLTSTGTLSITHEGAFSWIQKTPLVQTVYLKDGVFMIRYEDEAPEVMTAETPPGRSVGRTAPHFGRKARRAGALRCLRLCARRRRKGR